MLKKVFLVIATLLASIPALSLAQEPIINDLLGQHIHIKADFDYVNGPASLSIIIRDLDHRINIPYIFDISPGINNWIAFTYSRHYIVKSAKLIYVRYRPKYNAYQKYVINDFCHLQSGGRILRNTSMTVWVTGGLPHGYRCNIARFTDRYFTIVR